MAKSMTCERNEQYKTWTNPQHLIIKAATTVMGGPLEERKRG